MGLKRMEVTQLRKSKVKKEEFVLPTDTKNDEESEKEESVLPTGTKNDEESEKMDDSKGSLSLE